MNYICTRLIYIYIYIENVKIEMNHSHSTVAGGLEVIS